MDVLPAQLLLGGLLGGDVLHLVGQGGLVSGGHGGRGGRGDVRRGVVHGARLPQVDGVVVVQGAPAVVDDHHPGWGVDLPTAGPVPDKEGEDRIHQEGDDLGPGGEARRLDNVLKPD